MIINLRKIINFFGLQDKITIDRSEIINVLSKRSNINKEYLLPKNFENWPIDKIEIFKDICGRYMDELEYN